MGLIERERERERLRERENERERPRVGSNRTTSSVEIIDRNKQM